ncbi:MAG: biotin--[acetyl-CoA-carboxylase] ligase [Bacilli bacterium]|nr:biotin--[acetyl-CoA-carboxylase] ligase [Bacilli bacterium]
MELIHFEKIDSTSTYLKEQFSSLSDFTFVSTNYQSAGRGRQGRTWVGEKNKNLLFSFVIKDPLLIPYFKDISLSCAYVLAKTLESMFGISSNIKWPNDVYINHKKTCGILLESHMENGEIDGLIVGIGINVNQTSFPSVLIYPVTSIALTKGGEVDIETLKQALYTNLVSYLPALKEGKKDHLEFAKKNNELLGKEVYAEISGEKKKVKVIGIDDDCSLILEIDGKRTNVISGEISFHV